MADTQNTEKKENRRVAGEGAAAVPAIDNLCGSCSLAEKASEWEKLLRSRGSRLTQPRKAILALLCRHSGHFNTKEIFNLIHPEFPEIGLTTVYRTLDLLVRLRLLNRCDFGDGQSTYERVGGPEDHHHHLICERCGLIIDYNDFITDEVTFYQNIQKYLTRKYDFQISGHEVQFFGKCRSCRGTETAP